MGNSQDSNEPVAWSHINGTSDTKWHPPQRKPLTEEDIQAAWDSVDMRHPRGNETRIAFARAVEAALAEPVQAKFDDVAVEQWKLRMVFYDENGEPLMSRQPEPDEILAALTEPAEPVQEPYARKPPATIDEMFDRMDKAPKGVFFGHDPMTIWMEAWRAAEQHHGIKEEK